MELREHQGVLESEFLILRAEIEWRGFRTFSSEGRDEAMAASQEGGGLTLTLR